MSRVRVRVREKEKERGGWGDTNREKEREREGEEMPAVGDERAVEELQEPWDVQHNFVGLAGGVFEVHENAAKTVFRIP